MDVKNVKKYGILVCSCNKQHTYRNTEETHLNQLEINLV